jgi:hypothetical protein
MLPSADQRYLDRCLCSGWRSTAQRAHQQLTKDDSSSQSLHELVSRNSSEVAVDELDTASERGDRSLCYLL